ncbi:hypothetical protein Tco_1277047 [Tanacetum coccineum]
MELIRSYVTCSSERQQEIKEEWDAAVRASRKPRTWNEEGYHLENDHDQGGHWKSMKHRPNHVDDLSQPWLCEETDPFTTRIQNFKVTKRTLMPVNVKTYDDTGDPEDHLKIFQEAEKIKRGQCPRGVTCLTLCSSALPESGLTNSHQNPLIIMKCYVKHS